MKCMDCGDTMDGGERWHVGHWRVCAGCHESQCRTHRQWRWWSDYGDYLKRGGANVKLDKRQPHAQRPRGAT